MKARIAALFLLAILSPARAEDWKTDLAVALTDLHSDDADVRDRGSLLLESMAGSDGSFLWPFLNDSDAEVRARVYNVLRHSGRLPKVETEALAVALLDAISETAAGDELSRGPLIDELLLLGEPATRVLQAELSNRSLEPVASPIRLIHADAAIPFRSLVRNSGTVGLWIPAEADAIDMAAFRVRAGQGGPPAEVKPWQSCGGIGSTFPQLETCPSPSTTRLRQYPLRNWLIHAVRLKPGGTEVWAEGTLPIANPGTACGTISLGRADGMFPSPAAQVASGVSLCRGEEEFPAVPCSRFLVLNEVTCREFTGRIAVDGTTASLELTAHRAFRPVHSWEAQDRFWYAAIGPKGEIIEFGAMHASPSAEKPWENGESRSIMLERPVPTGTHRLWLGYDFGIDRGETGQFVPAPAEVKNEALTVRPTSE